MRIIHKTDLTFRLGGSPDNLDVLIPQMPIVLELASRIFAGIFAAGAGNMQVEEMYDWSFKRSEELIEEFNKRYVKVTND